MDQSVVRRIDEATQAASGRPNLYAAVHKGLRAFMGDTLVAIGRADPNDAQELASALQQVRDLLEIALSHLEHEDRFMHTAMEACRPGSSERTADDHQGHLEAIAALRAGLARVENSEAQARGAAVDALYRRLARFVAENFEHMEIEESQNMAVLWEALDDAQLESIHGAIIQAIPPLTMARFQRWILPSVSHPERVGMLAEMRANAPAPAFEAAIAIARERLSQRDFAKLARELAVAATPQLVEQW